MDTCKLGVRADKRTVSVLIFNEQWMRPSLHDIWSPYHGTKEFSDNTKILSYVLGKHNWYASKSEQKQFTFTIHASVLP
jgi:hypothetical protein